MNSYGLSVPEHELEREDWWPVLERSDVAEIALAHIFCPTPKERISVVRCAYLLILLECRKCLSSDH